MLKQLRKEKMEMRSNKEKKQAQRTERQINFLGDGSSVLSDLYAPKGLNGREMHLLLEKCWSNQEWKNLRQKRVMAKHNNDKFSNEDNILLFCCMFLRY
ncbi:hypothetical protein MTR67_036050 [Solanum verrucosum]|uniref:Uncharacterized protein n=1 Tax=Solanum verrucosum TaxID=315347 RepID=A0AAF0ZM68_SOLVR|nr:hypothetical protein MTR67_036050 [Solanum verrucosum]